MILISRPIEREKIILSNKESLERFYSNKKIVEKNPMILKDLSTTFEVLGKDDMLRYEKLLEVIDFDRVVTCARFVTMNGILVTVDETDESDIPKDIYFSRWKNETFWKDLERSSAVSKNRRVIRYKIKDILTRQLRSVLTRSDVRLDHRKSSKLYYIEDNQIKILENFSEESFVSFCMHIFARYLRLSESDVIKTALRYRVRSILD